MKPILFLFAVSMLPAQAPLLQDGANALRRARLDWTAGDPPLQPSSMPSLEVGWGGAGSDGAYAPLVDGEGLGQGTRGWGLGLQGRYVSRGWFLSVTALALRDRGHTLGTLQRAALGFQSEAGWRAAVEQAPFAWGSGLTGGDLLGASARAFPRLTLATPEAVLPLGRWRGEAFAGRLEPNRPVPEWSQDRQARLAAQVGGFDLQKPLLWGGLLRTAFGSHLETSFGAVIMDGGRDGQGQPAPASSARTQTLAEVKVRIPSLARFIHARGASLVVSRGAAPDGRSMSLAPARELAGLQLVWDGWDLGLEYAGAATHTAFSAAQPAYLAGFSTHGEALGPAFGHATSTRTVDLGWPLFLEGQGRFKLVRAISALADPSGTGSWFCQADAQWRTPTGRIGASVASRREEHAVAAVRWGWTCSLFQAFRVF